MERVAGTGMQDWRDTLARIEPLEDVALDAALVDNLQRRFNRLQGARVGGVNFYTPTFKAYASSEIHDCGKSAWPAVSVTGGDCKLQCDHCKAKVLEPMLAARTADDLWRVVNEQIDAGARGMLLTGGSNHRDEVEYGPFYPTIRRIKDAHPDFRIAVHTALVDRDTARRMEDSGLDVAMLDIIGAQDTIQQVYHLKRPVADFEASLAYLNETSMKVVPHIVLGLHYGHLLGEWNALEIVARNRPDALVLVVIMPFYAAPGTFVTPDMHEVGRMFLESRARLADKKVLLGCARPAGMHKRVTDAYAVMAGLDGIAFAAEGAVAVADMVGRRFEQEHSCCSIKTGLDEGAPKAMCAA